LEEIEGAEEGATAGRVEATGQGEGGDTGMEHTGSTRYIGAAAGRGRSPEEVAVAQR
jgi:hypothetical protein